MQHRGLISKLEQQPQFWFVINSRPLKHANGHRVGYKSDFRYFDSQGRVVVEEVKGFTVRDWPLRRAVFLALYPDVIFREV